MHKVLVTGGTGFVGGGVLERLCRESRHVVVAAVRSSEVMLPVGVATVSVASLDGTTDWLSALAGVDVVVHCAARTHVMKETSIDPLMEYRKVNVEGTVALARQAAAVGVRRFVFLSSIKVNGESTQPGRPFVANGNLLPKSSYGISKYEAEQALNQVAEQTGMEVVIIRPPLTYGPGAKGNFFNLIKLVKKGIPLPFGAVTNNLRSFVSLDNLVDLIMTCLKHPAAANQTFLVSDGEDLSTADLLRRLGRITGTPARLLIVPVGLMQAGARLMGKQDVAQRLLGNLQVDIEHTCRTLGWSPSFSIDEGLRRVMEKKL